MTSMWGQLWNGRANTPPPAVVHIDMRSLDRTQVYSHKGWSKRLWIWLKGAVPGILALRLIPGEKMVKSLLGIIGGHGQGGKARERVCKVYHVDNLVTLPLGCDLVTLQEFDVPQKEDPLHAPLWLAALPAKLVG